MTSPPAQQRGAALLVVLLLSMIAISVGVTAATAAQTELRIAHNDLRARQALAAAEAGLGHAIAAISAGDDRLGDELAEGGTGGSLASLGRSATLHGVSYRFGAFGDDAGDGYYVRTQDNVDETSGSNDPQTDVDHRIRLLSRGRAGPAWREVEALIQLAVGPDCAILTQGNLSISGNPTVSGTKGCAHSNSRLEIGGNPRLERGATASGAMNVDGSPEMSGEVLHGPAARDAYSAGHQEQPALPIPAVRPLRFGPAATDLAQATANHPSGIRLDADGNAYVGPGQTGDPGDAWICTEEPPDCSGGTPVAVPDGWSSAHDTDSIPQRRWNVSGGSAADGIFFVEGSVAIGGSPGSPTFPWLATLVAMNSIRITGNPSIRSFTDNGALRNLLLVSGNDVELAGNPSSAYAGGIFAHQQIRLSGNPGLTGFLIAEDGRSTWAGDPAPDCDSGVDLLCDADGGNAISGNINVHYDGLRTAGFPDGVTRLSWKELRN